jgi:exopolysaccharide production protein ExoQ
MFKASLRFPPVDRAGVSAPIIDKYSLIPILACVYATIVGPLILTTCSPSDSACLLEPRIEPKIFWPVMAAMSVFFATMNPSRLSFPPHIIALLAYLALAGTSVLWAYKPESSSIRFAQQAMVVTSIVFPAMLAARTVDLMRGLFLCFAIAAILNLIFVFGRPPIDAKFATWGYPGYFSGKNYLGQCAAITFLLSLHQVFYPGLRRALGIIVTAIAVLLLFLSNSKTALVLALFVPLLAWLTVKVGKSARQSPAIILLSIPVCYAVLSLLSGFNMNRLSYILYGDSTFTGRTIIWDFAHLEIAHRPLLGWGYQSFWLVGPDAPSILNAPGWVKTMPNAHNGYLDTLLELGYVGFVLLMVFIIATLHAIGRVAERDLSRARLLLSLALFIILYNYLESIWMRGFEFLWVVFLFVVADAARYWRRLPSTNVRSGLGVPRPADPGPSRHVLTP